MDRAALGLAAPENSVKGVYKLLEANGKPDATIVYQGSDVAYAFVTGVLPRLKEKGINLDVYYIPARNCSTAWMSKKETRSIPLLWQHQP